MPENRLSRALYGLPILALALPMIRSLTLAEATGPWIEKFLDQSRYDLQNGGSVPLLKQFYKIPLIDNIFAGITTAFGPITFYDKPAMWWSSLVFLTDFTAVYAILVLESLRAGNKDTIFQYAIIPTFLAQLVAVGNVAPVWFYLFWVFSPVSKFSSPNARNFEGTGVAALLPMLITEYLLPHFLYFFHPDFEVRLWWNWVWQLFPVWGSITLFVLSKGLGLVLDNQVDVVQKRNKTILRYTIGITTALCTSIYWYALIYSGFSVSELFVPVNFSEASSKAVDALFVIFQHDYALSFASVLLWLAYNYWELKSKGICQASWARILSIAAIIGVAGGPGTLVLYGWTVRERIMASTEHGKVH